MDDLDKLLIRVFEKDYDRLGASDFGFLNREMWAKKQLELYKLNNPKFFENEQ